MRRRTGLSLLAAALLSAGLAAPATGAAAAPAAPEATAGTTSYLVVLKPGVGSAAATRLVTAAGGTVTADLTRQIGVVTATSAVPGFDAVLRASTLVETAGEDVALRTQAVPGGGPQRSSDPLETQQWDMQQIRTEQAHAVQAGSPKVDVGILDSGIDGRHVDFIGADGRSNVACSRGADFTADGPGVGSPDPCTDNQFHGTHVAGTVGARANGTGIVGVAPNVTLVPVKVCDAEGYCYASDVIGGITFAGDKKLDVINMSFFMDDDEFEQSTEFKCSDIPEQWTLRRAAERAIAYARSRGVTPVAALGNSDQDLAHPVDENGNPIPNRCEVVPAETEGVVGVVALGNRSEKASYSNYGYGEADVAAPGGNGSTGDPRTTILSTLPGGSYGAIQGTSMASPHAAGLAALIISQFGTVGSDGDVKMDPDAVAARMEASTVDIGWRGYDKCFGEGRIDALRAVRNTTTDVVDRAAPNCPEYKE